MRSLAGALFLATLLFQSVAANAVTRTECDAYLSELLDQIARNREATAAYWREVAESSADEAIKAHAEAAGEMVWNEEEMKRTQAMTMHRDCVAAAD